MLRKGADRERALPVLDHADRSSATALREASAETGIPAADLYGTASFYHLLDGRQVTRVCQGLTCKLDGADAWAEQLRGQGQEVTRISCLGQCDRSPAALGPDLEVVTDKPRGPVTEADPELPLNLGGEDTTVYAALAKAKQMGAEAVLDCLDSGGLQGRGGAGFPTGRKWRMLCAQAETERYVVCNADEAEPGTFKDRETMRRRPHLLLEGLAIAAHTVGASDVYIYVRGEYQAEQRALSQAIEEAAKPLEGLRFEIVSGHGAYICGEETALLEALEGKRGMPRLKPPFPTESGFRGKPTLINNVETMALVPSQILRGGEWFRGLGRHEPGTKLYSISGHVVRPGVYELPLGVSLDELVEAAGGYVGTPLAFSPGGASAGFLPVEHREVPLDFGHLAKIGSMLGSAGVVVLNDTVDMAEAAGWQAVFFEDESCGQCAPCRIGTRMLRRALDAYLERRDASSLKDVQEIAWEMEQGSICGLGFTAFLPLTTAMQHFPAAFGAEEASQ